MGNTTSIEKQFNSLAKDFKDAETITKHKLQSDSANIIVWESVADQLNLIRDFIEKYKKEKKIPSYQDKAKINLALMLSKNFPSPEDSNELAPLFKLNNEVYELGRIEISDSEALKLYEKLKQSS